MKNHVKLSLLLLSKFFSVQASEATYFQRMKAMIDKACNKYYQRQAEKREQEKQQQAETEFLKQISEEAEQYRQEEEKQKEEERRRLIEQEERLKQEQYQEYFGQQKVFYQVLVRVDIPGARPLSINVELMEHVLANCSSQILKIISRIEQRIFFKNKKNIIFYGPSGTGKSVLAQAIAIKCKVSCLFFNIGTISTEYMNSGVQNLNKIFGHAQELETKLGKPCVIIFDELEALTKKHAETNNHENNILISFWQELDKLDNSQVFVIGTMNNIDDVPRQISNRTYMIEIPLPTKKQREVIASYHLQKIQNKYHIEYPEWLTASYFAQQTVGFSNRDLENAVTEALGSAIKESVASASNKQMVEEDDVLNAIGEIKQEYSAERMRTFKKYLCDPKALTAAGLVISTIGIGVQLMGVHQTQRIADRQTSPEQIAKAGVISAFAVPVAIYGWFKGWYK